MAPDLLKEYNFVFAPAVKNRAHGRASGGLLVFYRKHFKVETLDITPWWIIIRLSASAVEIVLTSVYFKPGLDVMDLLESFQTILDDIDSKYGRCCHVIGGDFNCRVGEMDSTSAEILQYTSLQPLRRSLDQTLKSSGRSLIDFMTSNSFTLLNGRSVSDFPGQYTFVGPQGCSVVDLVFSNNLNLSTVQDLRVLEDPCGSPHFPVLITLKCLCCPESDRQPVVRERLRLGGERARVYQTNMYYSARSAYNFLDIDDACVNLNTAVHEAAGFAGAVVFPTVRRVSRKAWYDRDCYSLKRNLRTAFTVCKANNFSDIYRRQYVDAKRMYKATVCRKKRAHEMQVLDKLSGSANLCEFWKTVRLFRGNSEVDQLDVATWENFYDDIFSNRQSISDDFLDAGHPFLDSPITEAELSVSLAKCKNNKSPGKDGITYECLKYMPRNWRLYTCTLFNRILDTETTPLSWGEILLTMIHKKGPVEDPANYRGIALVNCLAKIFTQILLDRLILWSESNSIVPEGQSGFRAGRGCIDNVFVLSSVIHINLRLKKRRVFAAFVDFKRAFDSIDHRLLWAKLFDVGVSSKIIRVVRRLYKNSTIQINVGGRLSKKFIVTEGVLQGECLSPMLFSLFISDLEQHFRAAGHRGLSVDGNSDIILLLYADDLVLLGDSQADINRKLACLYEYCCLNGLLLNTEKTKVVCFGRGGYQSFSSFSFAYHDTKIEVVNKYTYLGVSFVSSSLFLEMANATTNKAKMTMGVVLDLMRRSKMNSWEGRMTLYNSILINSLAHCIGVWGLRYPDILETAQVTFVKRLLSLPIHTPSYILRLETGLPNICVMVFKLALSWLHKILCMDESRYPRICYDRLVYLDANGLSSRQYNWVSQVGMLLLDAGCGRSMSDLNAGYLRANKRNLVDAYRRVLLGRDLESLQGSVFSGFFPFFVFDGKPKAYLNFKCPIYIQRIVAQLRLSNHRRLSFYINGCTYTINCMEVCMVCNRNEPETISHIFFNCPLYNCIRGSFIRGIPGLNGLAHALDTLDYARAKLIAYYIISLLQLRAFVLDE